MITMPDVIVLVGVLSKFNSVDQVQDIVYTHTKLRSLFS